MQNKTLKYKSTEIFYSVAGKGKAVVLLHGFGEDGGIWKNQINFLKDHFLLIIPDIPGSGQSALIADANIDTYAEVVKHILDVENIQHCVMIGHSMGGYITLSFAEKYPDLLNGFGLFHSSAFADTEEKKQAREKSIAFIEANGAYNFLKTSLPGLFKPSADNGSANVHLQELIQKSAHFTKEALIQYYQAMIKRTERTALLRQSSTPVLFVIGTFDMAVPMQSSLQQCYLPSISHIHILRASAHMGMLEESEKSNTILFDFLSAI